MTVRRFLPTCLTMQTPRGPHPTPIVVICITPRLPGTLNSHMNHKADGNHGFDLRWELIGVAIGVSRRSVNPVARSLYMSFSRNTKRMRFTRDRSFHGFGTSGPDEFSPEV